MDLEKKNYFNAKFVLNLMISLKLLKLQLIKTLNILVIIIFLNYYAHKSIKFVKNI